MSEEPPRRPTQREFLGPQRQASVCLRLRCRAAPGGGVPTLEPDALGDPRKVSFAGGYGARVPALLTRPAAPTGAAILVQHGGRESKDDPLIRLILRRWAAAGFTCLAIDAPGHGVRATPAADLARRGFFGQVRSQVENVLDLRRGLDLVQSQPAVDPDRVGYWGVSRGGGIGVMLMAADPRVGAACLCLTGARAVAAQEARIRRLWPHAPDAAVEFVGEQMNAASVARQVRMPQVLMLNGAMDETIPRADACGLFEALACPKEQHWFRTAHKVTPAMLRASLSFFETKLLD